VTPKRKAILLSLAGGVTFALAAPPTDLYLAVLLGLASLFVAVQLTTSLRQAALMGCLWATAAGVVGMRFVPSVIIRFTPLGWWGGLAALILLSLFQSATWAAGMTLSRALERYTGLDARIAFATGTLLAISFTFVIAWTPAGLMSPWPALLQLADVIGERGVSFVLAAAVALVASPLVGRLAPERTIPDRRAWLAPAIGTGVFALLLVHGAIRMGQVKERHATLPTVKMGLVQAAVEARLRWEPSARHQILMRLRRGTIESERGGAELTIWPEAAYPYMQSHRATRMPSGARSVVSGAIRGPVLFGLITTSVENEENRYNATTLIDRQQMLQPPQAKLELLWFGETVPLGEHLPFLRRIFQRAGGLIPGTEVRLLTSGAAKMGVLNCYEDTLPGVGRRIAKAEPNLLVNVTNDAWFGPTAEPELHLRLSALRSIETRLDLVRAVNLGVPAWIDAAGSIRARGSADKESVLFVSPALNDMSPTFYVKAGDIPLLFGILIAVADAFYRRRRASRRPAITEPGP
jgi:apolipoprotein N-acyltransferase